MSDNNEKQIEKNEEQQSEPTPIKLELSDKVKSLMPYCGIPVVVHLKRPLVTLDCVNVLQMPGPDGQLHHAGVPGPAEFCDPETNEREPGVVADDVLYNVVLQLMPCGQRIGILQQTGPSGLPDDARRRAQTRAIVAHAIDPEEILAVSMIEKLPQQSPQGSNGDAKRIISS